MNQPLTLPAGPAIGATQTPSARPAPFAMWTP